jgi:hypothetical protein
MPVVLARFTLIVLVCAVAALGGGCASNRDDRLGELEEKVASLEAALSESRSASDAAVAQAREEAYADCRALLFELQERIWTLEGTKPYSFRIRSTGLVPSDPSVLVVDVMLRQGGEVSDHYLLKTGEAIIAEIAARRSVQQISFYFWATEEFNASGEAMRACLEWGTDSIEQQGEAKAQREVQGKSLRLVLNETDEPIRSSGWGGYGLRSLLFTESGRKQIFTDLVHRQDEVQGAPDYPRAMEEAKEKIASRYGITLDELNDLIHEGVVERWELPPSP